MAHNGPSSIGSLIAHLIRTVSVDIPESESEFGVVQAVQLIPDEANGYEPPQFTIRAILGIVTVVAIGCSAVASEYFGFGSLRMLLTALFTCVFLIMFLWLFVGTHTELSK